MVRAISFLLVCILGSSQWWPGFAQYQSQNRVAEVELRVQGIGLGSSYALVLRQFGRPLANKREKIVDEHEVCGPSYTSLHLSYEGTVIELRGDLRGRNFKVVSMEVTSPELLIAPGIKIGMNEKEVRSKLGVPFQERSESGFHILNYATKGNDGGAGFHFVGGRLLKVEWQYTLC